MNFNELSCNLKKCKICENKFGFKPHPIVWGDKEAKIVQISQAPSATVYKTQRPFSDQSGKKLKYEWYQIDDNSFYNINNFYITSLAHCYPGKTNSGNDKNPPAICYKTWLFKELNCINNEIYIIIGSKVAKVFFPLEKFDDLIFKDNFINGKLTFVLPYPSPLNIRWFKNHPEFMEKRIVEIRNKMKDLLNI